MLDLLDFLVVVRHYKLAMLCLVVWALLHNARFIF